MKHMVHNKLLALTVVCLIVAMTLQGVLGSPVSIDISKNISRKMIVVPGKGVTYAETLVSITVEGRGTINLVDRTFISGAKKVEFTGEMPDKWFLDGSFLRARWSRLRVDGKKSLNYKVVEKKPFVNVTMEVYFDGVRVDEMEYRDGFCVVEGDVPGEVRYVLRIRSNIEANGTLLPQTLILMLTVNNEYLSLVNSSLNPQFVTEMGEETTYNWMTTLDDEFPFNLTLRVKRVDPWGEVQLPPIMIMSTLDTSSVLSGLEKTFSRVMHDINDTDIFSNASLADMPSRMENMSIFFKVMGLRLANISAMLYNLSVHSRVASENLKKASEYAFKAADQIESSTSLDSKYISKTRVAVDSLYKVIDNLDKALSKLPYVPGNLRESVHEAKSEVQNIRSLLSKVESMQEKARDAATSLRSMGEYLKEASRNMEELGDMMLNISVSMNNASTMMMTLSEKFSKIGEEFDKLAPLFENTGSLLDMLASLKDKKDTLEKSLSVYRAQRPIATVGGERVPGDIVSDIESINLVALKVKIKRDIDSMFKTREKSVQPEEGKKGIGVLPVALVVGFAGSMGSTMLIRKRRNKVSVTYMERLEKITQELLSKGV